jgi:hypothetical protein
MMRHSLTLCFAASLLISASARADDPVSFVGDIAPILVRNCQACHGSQKAESGYRADTFERLTKPGDFEVPPITPGDLDESELYRLISSDDADERMPKDADPLPAEQIALIKRWIAEGAKFDGPSADAPIASMIRIRAYPQPPESYPAPVPITALAFHPEGAELFAGGYHELTVWDPADGSLVRRIKNLPQRIHAIRFSSDGSMLAVAGGTPGEMGEVRLVDPASGELIAVLGVASDVVFDVQFRPDGKRLAAASADRTIRVWNVDRSESQAPQEVDAEGAAAEPQAPSEGNAEGAAADTQPSQEGNSEGAVAEPPPQAEGSAEGKNSEPQQPQGGSQGSRFGDEVLVIENHADWVMAVAWSADGKRLASASRDKTAKAFDAENGQLLATYSGHNDQVYGVAFRSDAEQVFSAGRDRKIHQWKIEDAKREGEIGLGGEVFYLDGQQGELFSASADKTVRRHKEDRNQVRSFGGQSDWVFSVAVHRGTQRVAGGSFDGRVVVWNLEGDETVASFVAAPGYQPPP